MFSADQIKKNVAEKAISFIAPGMKVGLGSGTTTQAFIKALGVKVKSGLKIETIAASVDSERLALSLNIPLNIHLTHCDIYIDGADEMDGDKNCLKGLGKALFREKIIATMSRTVLILIDESKRSQTLHRAPLVCEILPFGYEATLGHIHKLGFKGQLRLEASGAPTLSDNGAFLYDIALTEPIIDPAATHRALKHIPGVLETGLFFNIVNKVLIGLKEGQTLLYE